MLQRPIFEDLKERNDAERRRYAERKFLLTRRQREEKVLEPSAEEELKLMALLADPKKMPWVEPLFLALRDELTKTNDSVRNVAPPVNGQFPGVLDAGERYVAALYGIMAAANQGPRDFTWTANGRKAALEVADARFSRCVAEADAFYKANAELFENTIGFLIENGERNGDHVITAEQWANVVRTLRARSISADHPNLRLLTQEALAGEIASESAAPSSIDLDFPDIDEASDVQIVVNNVLAMHIFYPSWMLEEARFYDVYDKIEELFLNQMLPISRGSAGDRIYARWKRSTQRISKAERLNFYASCFGAPGGSPALANQNAQFSDLWLRFVSGVSEWARKLSVDDLLRTRIPLSVSTEQVRKVARDLAANLSLHGYGVAYFAATELQNEINEIKDILSDEEVRLAYGARDMRQLIEQVSIYELGGARDVTRYFTMATSGAVITRWLANKANDLSGSYLRSILDIDVVRKPTMRQPTVRATRNPTDRDLVDACEQWLAVTGTTDDRVAEFAQPSETPAMTSRPVPQFAKEYLDGMIPAGMGMAAGNGNGMRGYARR